MSEQSPADLAAIFHTYRDARRDALIPLLQEVQAAQGYLSEEAVLAIGQHLNLPASKIYGVATFYNEFRFQPRGRWHIRVCRGTACHVKGSAGILATLCAALQVSPGETTPDGAFSLEAVGCVGACGLAPVIMIGDDVHGRLTPDAILPLLATYRGREAQV